MKFLADMGISPKTISFLKTLTYDAVHLHEQGLDRLADPDILKKAHDEGRILLTHDLGFGDLLAASKGKLPSVIIFRLKKMHPDSVNRYLIGILEKHAHVLEKGSIVSVNEARVRVKYLPI